MKHPALTRIFAVVLALLCLTMLLAGLGSGYSAVKVRNKSMADYQRLHDRIEEYREILLALEGRGSYQEADEALQKLLSEHEEKASKHRVDLAVFTATKGGLQAGEEALKEAEAKFRQGKLQFEKGLQMFEKQESAFWEGYKQFQEGKKQLAEAKKTLDLAESALASLRAEINQGRSLSAILESDDEDARQEFSVAAYDSMLQALDGAVSVYDTLKDQGGVSPEQMQLLARMLAENSDVDAGEFLDNVSWEGISAESLQEMEDQVVAATGMTVDDIRAEIQQQRDSIAGMDEDAPISEEQFALLQAAYAQNRSQLAAIDNALDGKVAEYEAEVSKAREEVDAAQAQVDEMEPVLEQGRAGIEQGRAAMNSAAVQIRMGEQKIAEGRRELEEKKAELAEQGETLRQEKEKLDAEAEELTRMSAEVQELQDLEKRETSVRLMLLERDGIRDLKDGGMELLPAAETYAGNLLAEISRVWTGRLWIAALLVLGGLAGFAGIPAAFEKTHSRLWLILPVLLSFALAAAAETLCRLQGRGDSYSALAVAVFAAVQLLLVIPKAKKA